MYDQIYDLFNFLGIEECSYKRLDTLAKAEGNLIRKFGSHGQKSLEECQAECDRIEGCNSIGVCPRDGCYLYDKKITPSEPTKTNVDCYTSYKSCSSKTINLTQMINLFSTIDMGSAS